MQNKIRIRKLYVLHRDETTSNEIVIIVTVKLQKTGSPDSRRLDSAKSHNNLSMRYVYPRETEEQMGQRGMMHFE